MEVPPKSDEESSKSDTDRGEAAATKRPARSRLYRSKKPAKASAKDEAVRDEAPPPVKEEPPPPPPPAPEPVQEALPPAQAAEPAPRAEAADGGHQQGGDGHYD